MPASSLRGGHRDDATSENRGRSKDDCKTSDPHDMLSF
jgi:hypothetical protein